MEKCTYCIQRINAVRMDVEKTVVREEERARQANTPVQRQAILDDLHGVNGAPGRQHHMASALQSACQQACPAHAIIFGDLKDKVGPEGRGSLVRQLENHPLEYTLLDELNTKPRTRYLARLTNPNPAMPAGSGGDL